MFLCFTIKIDFIWWAFRWTNLFYIYFIINVSLLRLMCTIGTLYVMNIRLHRTYSECNRFYWRLKYTFLSSTNSTKKLFLKRVCIMNKEYHIIHVIWTLIDQNWWNIIYSAKLLIRKHSCLFNKWFRPL